MTDANNYIQYIFYCNLARILLKLNKNSVTSVIGMNCLDGLYNKRIYYCEYTYLDV